MTPFHPPLDCERNDRRSPTAQAVSPHGVSAYPANETALGRAMVLAAIDEWEKQ